MRRANLLVAAVGSLLMMESAQAATTATKYILMFKQPNASSAPAVITDDDVTKLGGNVEARASDRLIVSLPDVAVAAMQHHPLAKYLQKAVTGLQSIVTPAAVASPASSHLMVTTTRLQPQTEAVWDSGAYAYDAAGNLVSIGVNTYAYDQLSRASGMMINGSTVESYTFDSFGNMTVRMTQNQSFPTPIDSPFNRLTWHPYDSAGNLTANGTEHYSYDAFKMMKEKDFNGPELYVYTASDERIGVLSGDRWLWSVRDEDGKVLRQYESMASWPNEPWLWVEDYVYRDGLLLGSQRVPEEGGRRHFHLDHLGTPRLITGDGGMQVAAHDYYPFGNEITPLRQETLSGFSREEPMKFTGHERDFTSGTSFENVNYYDYMHARHGSPGWGRFLSIDSVPGDPRRPQSWNRYSYVENNPMKYTDPTGMLMSISGWIDVEGDSPDTADHPGATFFWERWMDHPIFQATLHELKDLNAAVDRAKPYVEAGVAQAGIFIATEGFGTVVEEAIGATLLTDVLGRWEAGTFESSLASLEYHYGKHAAGQGVLEFTRAAQTLFRDPTARKVAVLLKDGTHGVKVITKTEFGIYTLAGRIISYGAR